MRRIARFFSLLLTAVLLCSSSALADQTLSVCSGLNMTFPDENLFLRETDTLISLGKTDVDKNAVPYGFVAFVRPVSPDTSDVFSTDRNSLYVQEFEKSLQDGLEFEDCIFGTYSTPQAKYLVFEARVADEPVIMFHTVIDSYNTTFYIFPVKPGSETKAEMLMEILLSEELSDVIDPDGMNERFEDTSVWPPVSITEAEILEKQMMALADAVVYQKPNP